MRERCISKRLPHSSGSKESITSTTRLIHAEMTAAGQQMRPPDQAPQRPCFRIRHNRLDFTQSHSGMTHHRTQIPLGQADRNNEIVPSNPPRIFKRRAKIRKGPLGSPSIQTHIPDTPHDPGLGEEIVGFP